MIIQNLNYIETAEANYIEGGSTASTANVTVVGTGPTAAVFGATTGGLSLDVFSLLPPAFSFDVGFGSANGLGFGLFGFGGNAFSTTITQ